MPDQCFGIGQGSFLAGCGHNRNGVFISSYPKLCKHAICTATAATATQSADLTDAVTAIAPCCDAWDTPTTDPAEPTEAEAAEGGAAEHNIGILVPPALLAASAAGLWQ